MESEEGASSNQVNEQALQDYLAQLRETICDDIQDVINDCCNGGGAATTAGASAALPDLADNTTVSSGRTINGNPTFYRLVYQAGFLAAGTVDIAHNAGAFTDMWVVQALARRPDTIPAQHLPLPYVGLNLNRRINVAVRGVNLRVRQGTLWTGLAPDRISELRILVEFY